jgi:hypothetical protein
MRFPRLLPALLALAFLPSPYARAEDEEPPTPKEDGKDKEKPAKPQTIFKDWKEVKKKGVAHAKERAAHWEAQGVKGKDLLWLGLMWDRGQEFAKSAAAIEESLKATDITDANKEVARVTLIKVYGWMRDWPKMAAAAATFREQFPVSGASSGTYVDEGRAHRMAGDKAKAIATFTQGAEANELSAILELVDLHMADGEVDAAKAVLAKYAEADIKGKEQYFAYLGDFLSVVGTKAPFDGAKAVKGDVTTLEGGKPTLVYFWHMQVTNPEARLGQVTKFANAYGEQVSVAAIASYNQYNPETSKKDDTMTEEQELDWYKKFAETIVGRTMPPATVVPKATLDGLKLKFEGTKLLIDKEGKFRYARIFEIAPYAFDWQATELAVKKALGS